MIWDFKCFCFFVNADAFLSHTESAIHEIIYVVLFGIMF